MRTLPLALLAFLSLSSVQAAECYIAEYRYIVRTDDGRDAQIAREPIATQVVTFTTSTQSAAFNTNTEFIRVVCNAKAHFNIEANPAVATDQHPYLPPDTVEYFGVTSGVRIAFVEGV